MITRLSILAAGLVIASAAGAQATAQQPASQAPQQVTKAQFTQTIDARFAGVDTNKDGQVTKAEITAAQTKALAEAQVAEGQRLEAEFNKLDTNKDKQLSLAEFKAAVPPLKPTETADQMIANVDTNKDGKISAAEYRAQPVANFDKADANHDGILTAEELAAARKK